MLCFSCSLIMLHESSTLLTIKKLIHGVNVYKRYESLLVSRGRGRVVIKVLCITSYIECIAQYTHCTATNNACIM